MLYEVITNDEDDAAVIVLQDKGIFAVVHARHDDMAALYQAYRAANATTVV